MINIKSNKFSTPAFLHLGFRPFFLIAGISSVVLMLLWLLFYQGILAVTNTTPSNWHAHEMIFGYSAAVIVGFLLTASKNWSKIQTIYNKSLLGLLIVWMTGRFLGFVEIQYLIYQSIIDVSFLILSTIAIAHPIFKAKLWNNIGIVVKIFLFALAHILYYLELFGVIVDGKNYGLYLGFYLIISLLLLLSRRLLPFFIERGLGLKTELKNSRVMDISSLILFSLFIVLEIFFNTIISNVLAGLLFVIHAIRVCWWFDKNIWKKSLLWSIYIAYCLITLGFSIKFLSAIIVIIPNIDVHFFAFGIGLMTLSMMARVSLGHTGRNVFKPPKILNIMFILIIFSFISRVLMPMFLLEYYIYWVLLSQILWITSFSIFVWIYAPLLFKARIDVQFG